MSKLGNSVDVGIVLFEERVIPARRKLMRFAYYVLGNSEEAKDVVQEVFVKVWNARERLSEIQNIEGWCVRLTKNLSIDRLRSRTSRRTESMSVCFNIKMESLTPYENVEIQESNAKIIQWMEALPKKQRQVIHLRDVEGHSYNEICDILGIDLTMVKVRLFRARKTLKEKFLKVHSYGL